MSQNYNKRHMPKSFNKGQLVALSTKNLRLKAGKTKKLSPRFIGLFRILETVGKQAYRLLLPEKYAIIHNVFPIQLLEEWQ
jgi:thiamine monophosphate synthase